ncbi:MAG: hypothetical protein HYT89_06125 [Candidatus Omnitrophica bacterium]|nr:hypothetical protein [Candidatus Omnitrophota bacterium]
MKKRLALTAMLAVSLSLAGCASLPKKFIRKKKTPAHVAQVVYLQQGGYVKQFSNEYYYKTHFTFWKSWHEEWLRWLGGNRKKVSRCAQESVNHLTEMIRYLSPEKQEELRPDLERLSRLALKAQSGEAGHSDQSMTRSELERIQRAVEGGFTYNKMKDYLLPETIDLAPPDAASAADSTDPAGPAAGSSAGQP